MPGAGNRELNPVFFIHLAAGSNIEIGHREFAGCLFAENPQRVAEDGVIAHFHFMAVTEDKNSGREFLPDGGMRRPTKLLGALIARWFNGLRRVIRRGLLLAKGLYFIRQRLDLTGKILLLLGGDLAFYVTVRNARSLLVLHVERRPQARIEIGEGIARWVAKKGRKRYRAKTIEVAEAGRTAQKGCRLHPGAGSGWPGSQDDRLSPQRERKQRARQKYRDGKQVFHD